MNRSFALVTVVVVAACPKGGDKPKPVEPAGRGDAQSRLLTAEDGGLALPPAPPLPPVPASLPPPPVNPRITAEAVALGELLFHDPRLSADGKRACASCHDPARGYSGGIDAAADGRANLRRTPTLVNLAWVTELGWDGRSRSIAQHLPAHATGQLGNFAEAVERIAVVPTYRAHITRIGGTPIDAISAALEAFVLTRYEGDAPWDAMERTARATPGAAASDPVVAGYQLFTGKAQCAVCHTPPLYTDHGYHRIEREALGDKGRGLVDPAQSGAFRTPTLRGATVRGAYFHTGSKKSIDEVIAHYQAMGAAPADPAAIDPMLAKIRLTPAEAKQLATFLNMLTVDRPPPTKPLLP